MNAPSTRNRVAEGCRECGLCLTRCTFLSRRGTPGKIARTFEPSGGTGLPLPFECSLCGLCDAVCPEDLNLKEFFLDLRRESVARTTDCLSAYRRLLAYEKRGMSRRHTLRLLPEGCDTVLFPGCTLPAILPEAVTAVYGRLSLVIPRLGVVLDCCGKISHDLGRTDFFHHAFSELKDHLVARGVRHVVTVCPSCTEMFRLYGEPLTVRSVYPVLDEYDLTGPITAGRTVQVHDCCVDRFQDETLAAFRSLLKKQGLEIEEMASSGRLTVCCGEGGMVSSSAPELADIWLNKRKDEVSRTLAAPCAGCVTRLTSHMDVVHGLEIWLDPDRALSRRKSPPRWPVTSWNRLLLKRKLKRLPGRFRVAVRKKGEK